jgi:hypothetical protein
MLAAETVPQQAAALGVMAYIGSYFRPAGIDSVYHAGPTPNFL